MDDILNPENFEKNCCLTYLEQMEPLLEAAISNYACHY